ncbi:hypothetical protein SAMN04487898_117125 [Pedobacter sp. ok626]|uniref:DUF6266 family protein n=1 Tax=Pedobacter sp. ok626 TaxID=1761882 RepID=UPI000887172C|nr:DUF6266 family protein [Pedobacter sp. ok626]SDL34443.1 hypothetical protein SAMN04487898_117125 [Pedobacter sp. ok626]
MGILKSGIIGPVRNKTGPLVGRMHRSTNVVTAAYRASTKPPTTSQLGAQDKFSLLSSFLSNIDDLIKIGFKQFSKGKDPMNVASAYNYDHAFLATETGFTLNYPQLVYSRGYILPAESPAILPLPKQIEFNWLPQRQSMYCQYTDMATFLVYNPEKGYAISKPLATDRYAQGYLLDLPKEFAGDTVHCYMSFASKDGKLQGNSTYLGQLTCV